MTTGPKPLPRVTAEDRLPGDPTRDQAVARMIRVDQAGEYGAVRIYRGQLAVLGRADCAATLRAMADKEREHLQTFDRLIAERRVRPTLLSPLWHTAGFMLGAATALLGDKAAMACTQAVEEVIDAHYAAQARALGDDEAPLREIIERARADECHHRDVALAEGALDAPAYAPLVAVVKAGSQLAIWLSTRL